MDYVMTTTTSRPYEEALAATKAALREQGFGVLIAIDVKTTLAEKLGVEFRRYDIIGACNPAMAVAGEARSRLQGALAKVSADTNRPT